MKDECGLHYCVRRSFNDGDRITIWFNMENFTSEAEIYIDQVEDKNTKMLELYGGGECLISNLPILPPFEHFVMTGMDWMIGHLKIYGLVEQSYYPDTLKPDNFVPMSSDGCWKIKYGDFVGDWGKDYKICEEYVRGLLTDRDKELLKKDAEREYIGVTSGKKDEDGSESLLN